MLCIHHTACISPQQSFGEVNIEALRESINNQLKVLEPAFTSIPPGLLRRMGKAVKIGVGSALSLLPDQPVPSGIIIGTANGGMEDCIKFLNQIIEYEEGVLAPGNFVQSTANAIASQLGLLNHNHAYNATHVHRGHAFENAMLDAMLLTDEHPGKVFLLGAVDEISTYNYHIDLLDGWYKLEPSSNFDLYKYDSDGSLAGEGAAMFLVNNDPHHALAVVKAVQIVHSDNAEEVAAALKIFLGQHLGGNQPDWMISGENGDPREKDFSDSCKQLMKEATGIVRFKHMCGEYPTASSFALWLACFVFHDQSFPAHAIVRQSRSESPKTILIYNHHKKLQHSFILVEKPGIDR